MLFVPPDVSQPLRLQGAFVSDGEIDKLIRFWRTAVDPSEIRGTGTLSGDGLSVEQVAATQPSLFPNFEEPAASQVDFGDELLPTSVEIFLAENRASTSLLQRRLRIGYTRAARLMELLADMGVVTDEMKGQSKKVNRSVAEELMRSINAVATPNGSDSPPF
jgi:DNA segregation ATPase FtsK/SpoIIIE, S-DNA-T family